MIAEEQWQLTDHCLHCGCPVFRKDGKIKWTGERCQCELEREVDSQEDSNDLPRYD